MDELLKWILTVGGMLIIWGLYTWWMCRKDRKELERRKEIAIEYQKILNQDVRRTR